MSVQVPILTYHKIAPVNSQSMYPGTFVPPELFDKHLRYLQKKGFQTVHLADLFSEKMPAKPIVLTFDDGFQDFEDLAFPLLKKYGMTATVFLVADCIGKTNEWDTVLGDVSYPLMSAESIRKLHSAGIEFGSHTSTHPRLSTLDPVSQEQEIIGSRIKMEDLLEFPISTFCYPYGSYDDTSIELVKKAGYRFATTCDKGLNDGSEDPAKLKRIAMRNDTSLPVFIYKLWRAFKLGR